MIKPAFLSLTVALLPLAANAQVHKCEIEDTTVYQDKPCPGAETPITLDGVMIYEAPDLRELRRALPTLPDRSQSLGTSQSSLERRNERVQAQARGEIVPGMTVGQLYAMLGEPSSRSDIRLADGENCKRWTWIDPQFVENKFYSAIVCNGEVKEIF